MKNQSIVRMIVEEIHKQESESRNPSLIIGLEADNNGNLTVEFSHLNMGSLVGLGAVRNARDILDRLEEEILASMESVKVSRHQDLVQDNENKQDEDEEDDDILGDIRNLF
jgi:hypothetical protein